MKNAYYVITLPADKNKSRLDQFVEKGVKSKFPRENMTVRFNKDQTKVLVQGDIPDNLEKFIKNKAEFICIGECLPNGQAEQKVYDYLETNKAEWQPIDTKLP